MNVLMGNNNGENLTVTKTDSEILGFRKKVDLYDGSHFYSDRFSLNGQRLTQTSSLILNMTGSDVYLYPYQSYNIVYLAPGMITQSPIQIQALNSSGEALWGIEGKSFNDYQSIYRFIPDNAGGLFLIWYQSNSFYVTHINSDGEYTQTTPFIVNNVNAFSYFPDGRDYFRCDEQGNLNWIIITVNANHENYKTRFYRINSNCQLLYQISNNTDIPTYDLSLIHGGQLIVGKVNINTILQSYSQTLTLNWSLQIQGQVMAIMPFNNQKFYVLSHNYILHKSIIYEISTTGALLSQSSDFSETDYTPEYITSFIEDGYLYFAILNDFLIERLYKVNGSAGSVEFLQLLRSQYGYFSKETVVLTGQGEFFWKDFKNIPDETYFGEGYNRIVAGVYHNFSNESINYTVFDSIQPSYLLDPFSISVNKGSSFFFHRFKSYDYSYNSNVFYKTNQADEEFSINEMNYISYDKFYTVYNDRILMCSSGLILLTDENGESTDALDINSYSDNFSTVINNETDKTWVSYNSVNGVSLNKIINNQFSWGEYEKLFQFISKPVCIKGRYLVGEDDNGKKLIHFNENGEMTAGWPAQGVSLTEDDIDYFEINDNFIEIYNDFNGQDPVVKAKVFNLQNNQSINQEGTIILPDCEFNKVSIVQNDNAFYFLYAHQGDVYMKKYLIESSIYPDNSFCLRIYNNSSNLPYGYKFLKLIMNNNYKLVIYQNDNNDLLYRIINPEDQIDNQDNGFLFCDSELDPMRDLYYLTSLNLLNNETVLYFFIPYLNGEFWIANQKIKLSFPFSDNQDITHANQKVMIYPNPFNTSTTIEILLQKNTRFDAEIYNIKGQKVKTLLIDKASSENQKVIWDGRNQTGEKVSSGIYFARVKTDKNLIIKKMMIIN